MITTIVWQEGKKDVLSVEEEAYGYSNVQDAKILDIYSAAKIAKPRTGGFFTNTYVQPVSIVLTLERRYI